jgi:hypothetical protein
MNFKKIMKFLTEFWNLNVLNFEVTERTLTSKSFSRLFPLIQGMLTTKNLKIVFLNSKIHLPAFPDLKDFKFFEIQLLFNLKKPTSKKSIP